MSGPEVKRGLYSVPFRLLREADQAKVAVNPDAPVIMEGQRLIQNWTEVYWGKEGERHQLERVAILRQRRGHEEIVGDTVEYKSPPAVIVIPMRINSKGKLEFLLIKQKRPQFPRAILTFPQGHVKKGETVTSAARRELAEETGYAVSGNESQEVLGAKARDVTNSRSTVTFVLIQVPFEQRSTRKDLEEKESVLGLIWKTLPKLSEMKLRLLDARTIVGIDYLEEKSRTDGFAVE